MLIIFLFTFFCFCNGYSQTNNAYADVIVETHFEPNHLGFKHFYGGYPTKFPLDLPLTVVLEEDNRFISLPKGSFMVLKFTDNFIIDGEGPDLFLKEIGASGERASVYVSSNGIDFTYLGIAKDDSTTALDLSTIKYTKPVRYVKVIGLDNFGGSPGFDLECVYAMPRSNVKAYTFLRDFESQPDSFQLPIKILFHHFNYTENELTPDVLHSLSNMIDWLKQHPNTQLKIIAHCDNFGSTEFQDKETYNRAKYLFDFMVSRGLDPKRAQPIGMGSRQPLKSISNDKRNLNRRIELEISRRL